MVKTRLTFIFLLALLLMPALSAEIIIEKNLEDTYNLGDSILIPITIKSSSDIMDTFNLRLLCAGKEQTFYTNGVYILAGEERDLEPLLILNKNMIGNSKGDCKLKGELGEEYITTANFFISDKLTITPTSEEKEFNPGENFILRGEAIKANGKAVEGIIEATIGDTGIIQKGAVTNGFFDLNLAFPKDMPAGSHAIQLNAYEKDNWEEKTNQGDAKYIITINSVPTNLELISEEKQVLPGKSIKVKGILHDQTGESMEGEYTLTIYGKNKEIQLQKTVKTEEITELPIEYKEPSANWTIEAILNKDIKSKTEISIPEYPNIKVEIINKTLLLTNTGNVIYDKNLSVEIGNKTLTINPKLGIDEQKKFALSAPAGEYEVSINSEDKNHLSQSVLLTGNAISIKEASQSVFRLVGSPLVWIFVIFILAVMAYLLYKKGYKRTFFGTFKKKTLENPYQKPTNENPLETKKLLNTKNSAIFSLSIKGDKQSSTIGCLKIKNYKNIKPATIEETAKKIVFAAENKKAFIYENEENIFFIFSPTITRTFKNQTSAVQLMQEIKTILENHNKLFKQGIEYGISLNQGNLLTKKEKDSLYFMSFGKLMARTKSLAQSSTGNLLLSKEVNDLLRTEAKTEKSPSIPDAYTIKEMRNKEANKKFIGEFVNRMRRE